MDYESIFVGTFATEELEDGTHRILFANSPNHSTYITFKKDVMLPSLPDGFEWEDDGACLCKYYAEDTNEYAFLTELVQTMEMLYKWTLGLPGTAATTLSASE